MPLAYIAPTTLPALVPDTTSGWKPLASSILITPIWAKPLAAPPPRATPIRIFGGGATTGGATTTGDGVGLTASPPPQAASRTVTEASSSGRREVDGFMGTGGSAARGDQRRSIHAGGQVESD